MFSVGRTDEALACALTYLLFHEGDEFMTENVEYYREILEHDGKPRKVRCRIIIQPLYGVHVFVIQSMFTALFGC